MSLILDGKRDLSIMLTLINYIILEFANFYNSLSFISICVLFTIFFSSPRNIDLAQRNIIIMICFRWLCENVCSRGVWLNYRWLDGNLGSPVKVLKHSPGNERRSPSRLDDVGNISRCSCSCSAILQSNQCEFLAPLSSHFYLFLSSFYTSWNFLFVQ